MTYDELKKYFDIDINKIDVFLNYLFNENEKYNLTSIVEKEIAIEKHIYDSLLISKQFDFKNKVVLDVGSGGGFPGIPLAILLPKTKFILLDSTRKKIDYLNNVIKLLDLKNVTTICSRVEQLNYKEKYDVIISRALSRLNIYLETTAKLCKVNGHIIALKGASGDLELNESSHALKELDLSLNNSFKDELPISKESRINYIFIKNKSTKNKYPRSYSLIKKNPL